MDLLFCLLLTLFCPESFNHAFISKYFHKLLSLRHDFPDSMRDNVAGILPYLSSSQVNDLVSKWESSYGANQGRVFDESQSGADAFSWSISTDLKGILDGMGITVTRDEYDALVKSWGQLTPWKGTQEALAENCQR